MATAQELDELTQYIRRVVPDSKHITRLEQNSQAGIVEFTWQARHFAVSPVLDVFELKGRNLLITGASMLMQAALRTKERNNKVVGATIETLRTAEENMRANPDRGLALLREVKKILSKLAANAN